MLQRIARFYSAAALIVFNFALLFVIINVGAWWLYRPYDPLDPELNRNAWLVKHGIEPMRRVYPGLSDAEIKKLMLKTQRFGLLFEPYIHMKSEPSVVEHTAFHQAGFRLIGRDQGPWPIASKAVNVFVFGGSTTVGSGVQDNDTIPAALQRHLRGRSGRSDINIYNFGTAGHYSTQERIYFEQLLFHGNRPDIVVFVDGLNDFNFWDDRPSNTGMLQNAFTGMLELSNPRGLGEAVWVVMQRLPITNLLRELQRRSTAGKMPQAGLINSAHAADNPFADPAKINQVIQRYFIGKAMIEAIAARFDIVPLLVAAGSALQFSRSAPAIPGDRRTKAT